MREKTLNKQVVVRLPLAHHESLEKIATRDDRTVSWLVRQAVREYLEGRF